MLPSFQLERHWIMDAFGRFLQYDSTHQNLITTPFLSQMLPNLFTWLTPPIEKLPHRAVLRLSNSLPSCFPPISFIEIAENKIALKNIETDLFLSSHAYEGVCRWHAEKINGWEHFYLLNTKMIKSLSLLTDPELIQISCDGKDLSHLIFRNADGSAPNLAEIAGKTIKIAENLSEFSKLADTPAYQTVQLTLLPYQADDKKIHLEVIPQKCL